MNVKDIAFVYDTMANICFFRESKYIRELTIKGATERNGEITGTWFQVNHLTNHWISFRQDKFRANKWEVFYKRISDDQITYYRRVFYGVDGVIVLSFTEKDEWIKDPSGKWRGKYDNK